VPIPIPITKALIVINANVGSKAATVSEASPIVAMTTRRSTGHRGHRAQTLPANQATLRGHNGKVPSDKPMSQSDAWRMIRRRAAAANISAPIG
jgi:hypothetical protein